MRVKHFGLQPLIQDARRFVHLPGLQKHSNGLQLVSLLLLSFADMQFQLRGA